MALTLVTPADAPSARDLRCELADAIADCEAADAAARQAKAIADKADRLLREAADNVQRLRASMEAAQRAATAHRARTITEALQAGIEPSAMPAPPQADMAALNAAEAHLRAMEQAAHAVDQERDKAAAVSARAANTVTALVTAIMEAEARVLAADILASFDQYWKLRDKLSGYMRIEETKLADLQREIAVTSMAKTADGLGPRQARAAAKNPLYLESSNWMSFLDRIATGSEKKWRDHGQRLANDASARFEESSQ